MGKQRRLPLGAIVTSRGFAGLEVRHLIALDAVASEASFRRAAERLGYTQSGISHQIAALERIVGQRLIDRPPGSNRIRCTQAGEALLRHGRAITARVNAAAADLAELADGRSSRLRLGTFQSVGTRVVPEVVRRVAARWPSIEVVLAESISHHELLSWVGRGEVDLTFLDLAHLESDDGGASVQVIPLLEDPVVLVVADDSPLTRSGRPVDPADLDDRPLIAYRTCPSTQRAEAWMRAGGVEPRVVLRSDDNATVHGLVAAGMGVALLPRLSVDALPGGVTALELAGEIPSRRIGIVVHADRGHSRAVQALVTAAREYGEGRGVDSPPHPASS
jgi:DNA-binding transcriptional LysR family regulator